jgi:hypothetical protein
MTTEQIGLRIYFEKSDDDLLDKLAKARGTSKSQTIRDLIHIHYDGLLERLDPEAIDRLEAGELDRRALALALHRHKQRKLATGHAESAA